MPKKRIKARELALRLLFQVDVGGLPVGQVLDAASEAVKAAPADFEYAEDLVLGVVEELDELDSIIDQHAIGWSVERMAKVDRNVLRLAIYELLRYPEVPVAVCLNDSVGIVRKYSTESSGRFVNGVLGSFVRERDKSRETVEAEAH